MRRISIKNAFIIVYIEFLISAISVWMVLGAFNAKGDMKPLGYVGGVLFWLGLLGGIISYILFFQKKFRKPNVLKFFSNKAAIIADAMFLVSLAAVIVLANLSQANQVLTLLFMFLLLLSLYSHFLFNGKIFTKILIENKKQKGRE